ncbi:WD40/YVTN/BNR-like repeat-containing protein [Virgisporangium aurantiacum]|uniref:Uncharacterized protein n=1 Tax=Virgisporangium aurantiacum TaxID=175570 RepID=A0A8J3Z1F9_9ACTN|nr:hypothetical protein [Virgisporangium aurantiacum]GIJ54528.1 hypothetical protein Vau01_020440 [Virgisporangium aurantiacum]
MVNRIYERFMDAADGDMPPSRLTADEVYAAAWRRRQRRVEVWTAVAVVALLVATIVGMQVRKPPAGHEVAVPPTPTPTPSPLGGLPNGTRDGGVVFAAATDADHLYAVITRCPGTDCTTQLLGSDDAGATWTLRSTDLGDPSNDYYVTAPAAGVLYRTVERTDVVESGPVTKVRIPKISTDGGRSWTDVQATTTPVTSVPANGWLECRNIPSQHPCPGLVVVDPATARSAPLATPPGFTVSSVVNVPAAAGFWVEGYDEEKKAPAVAVSTDRGRSWTVHAFAAEPRESGVTAASVDGVTGYAVVSEYHAGKTTRANPTPGPASSTHHVYRTGDAGQTWQRVDSGTALFGNQVDLQASFVARDGTHFVMTVSGWVQQWYVSRDNGHSYEPAGPTGLTPYLGLANAPMFGVVTHAPGLYLAFDVDSVYRSTDGLRFTRHPVRI